MTWYIYQNSKFKLKTLSIDFDGDFGTRWKKSLSKVEGPKFFNEKNGNDFSKGNRGISLIFYISKPILDNSFKSTKKYNLNLSD